YHRPLGRVTGIELVEPVLVAQVLHDRAALPERASRQPLFLEQRSQVGRALLQELGGAFLPPHVQLLAVEFSGSHADSDPQVVDARLEDAQRDGRHVALPASWYGSVSARSAWTCTRCEAEHPRERARPASALRARLAVCHGSFPRAPGRKPPP